MRAPAQTGAMMRRPAPYAAQMTAQIKAYPAPTGGWIANRNLALPNGAQLPPGAYLLENYFPTSRGAKMRRGSELYATLGDGSLPVTALFSYENGAQEELFGATSETIYNITTVSQAANQFLGTENDDIIGTENDDMIGWLSTEGLDVMTGFTGGDWVVVQFASSGGIYLIGVNGEDNGFIYDGTNFYPNVSGGVWSLNYDAETAPFTAGDTLTGGTSGATAMIYKVVDNGVTGTLWITGIAGGPFQDGETITDGAGGSATADGVVASLAPGITGIASSDLTYTWAYRNRLFYIQKDSLSAWYQDDVDAIGGPVSEIPLGGVFNLGGSLLFGASWSLDSGSGGSGLSMQCIFVTTEGEVAVFQGSNPEGTDWSLANVYRIGKPLGKRAHIRAGGDIVIATDIGFVPLSTAMQRDIAALSPSAVSYPIEDAWNQAVALRSGGPWNCAVWPSAQMVIVALPTIGDEVPTWFVANARTGAWAPFTHWDATCVEIFKNRCFFGSQDGRVVEANVTGLDQGQPFVASYVPLFDDLGQPALLKAAKMARATIQANVAIRDKMAFQKDYGVTLPAPPDAAPVDVGSVWGGAIWGQSIWGESRPLQTYQTWRVVVGNGYAVAPSLQITSGSIVPIDAEIIRVELAFEASGVIG